MEREQFEKLVEEAITLVPEWFLDKLENIQIFVEDEPQADVMRSMGMGRNQTLLGLYQGVPLDRRGFYYGNTLPDKITLYMGPILRHCKTEEEIEQQVRATVMHEIGHYFGLSDAELREIERG